MSREKKKRDVHYRTHRRKKSEKEFYSLRSLVPEITGVPIGNDGFEAAYAEVKRIVKGQQRYLGNVDNLKIHKDFVHGFIHATKAFYFGGELRGFYEKIRVGEKTSDQELTNAIEMLKDSLEKNPDTEDKQQLLEYVEAEETFTEHIDRIGKQYLADVELVDRIADHQIKLNVIQEYLNLQSTLFKEWRDNTESILLFQRGFTNRLISFAKERGLSDEDINTCDDSILVVLVEELVKRDSQILIDQIIKRNS